MDAAQSERAIRRSSLAIKRAAVRGRSPEASCALFLVNHSRRVGPGAAAELLLIHTRSFCNYFEYGNRVDHVAHIPIPSRKTRYATEIKQNTCLRVGARGR